MTTEQKFRAAVNVIRNLPKHGPVQPSHHVMLKFYAYFKQATEGPNKSSKPPFWDIVKKAKWDAWTKLGDMDANVAMQQYVDEFKKIVDTVSKSNANMDKGEIDNFYASVPMDDLELLIGPTLARSRPNSPVQGEQKNVSESHSETPSAKNSVKAHKDDESAKGSSLLNGNYCVSSGGSVKTEDEEDDEYFLDTIENSDSSGGRNRLLDERLMRDTEYPFMNGYAACLPGGGDNSNKRFYGDDHETNIHLTKVITSLQKDLEKVVRSVNLIEQRISQSQEKISSRKVNRPFSLTLSHMTLTVFLAWPVLIQLIFYWFRRRNR